MPGYATRLHTVRLGSYDFRIRALSDLQQIADPTGRASRAGISSSLWSLFWQIWPSGKVLAEAISSFDVAGKRILEPGCGLALSSLALAHRGANVVADVEPSRGRLLSYRRSALVLPPLLVAA
ncbi:MAG: hypothetical protein ABIO17_08860 [Pseudoxanthomonas sp.]